MLFLLLLNFSRTSFFLSLSLSLCLLLSLSLALSLSLSFDSYNTGIDISFISESALSFLFSFSFQFNSTLFRQLSVLDEAAQREKKPITESHRNIFSTDQRFKNFQDFFSSFRCQDKVLSHISSKSHFPSKHNFKSFVEKQSFKSRFPFFISNFFLGKKNTFSFFSLTWHWLRKRSIYRRLSTETDSPEKQIYRNLFNV